MLRAVVLLLVLQYQEDVISAFLATQKNFVTTPTPKMNKDPVKKRSQQDEQLILSLPRKIQSCKANITACLELLNTIPKDPPIVSPTSLQPIYLEALQVLHHQPTRSKNNNTIQDLAYQFYQNCPTESVRAKAISVCQSSFNTSLWFLDNDNPGVASINAALAALARSHQWDKSHELLLRFAPNLTTFSYNIVLMGMERANQGTAALALLQNMTEPDRASYHHTMGALGRDRENDAAYRLLDSMRRNDIPPNNATLDILVRAYGRTGDWAMVALVERLRRVDHWDASFPDPVVYRKQVEPSPQPHGWRWESSIQGLKQVGSGRDAWWEFATLGNFSVGLQPHRNPAKNGMKILLFQRDCNVCKKVGFLLMINSRTDKSSTMLGIFVHPDFRRLGLSKAMLAIWLDLLHRAGLSAKTGVINKPLLALILQHTFGFTPQDRVGVEVEVLPRNQGSVALYAPSLKSLEGVFGAREMERQKIHIVVGTPSIRGRRCRIKTSFSLKTHASIQSRKNKQFAKFGNLKYLSAGAPWQHLLLGINVQKEQIMVVAHVNQEKGNI